MHICLIIYVWRYYLYNIQTFVGWSDGGLMSSDGKYTRHNRWVECRYAREFIFVRDVLLMTNCRTIHGWPHVCVSKWKPAEYPVVNHHFPCSNSNLGRFFGVSQPHLWTNLCGQPWQPLMGTNPKLEKRAWSWNSMHFGNRGPSGPRIIHLF